MDSSQISATKSTSKSEPKSKEESFSEKVSPQVVTVSIPVFNDFQMQWIQEAYNKAMRDSRPCLCKTIVQFTASPYSMEAKTPTPFPVYESSAKKVYQNPQVVAVLTRLAPTSSMIEEIIKKLLKGIVFKSKCLPPKWYTMKISRSSITEEVLHHAIGTLPLSCTTERDILIHILKTANKWDLFNCHFYFPDSVA